MTGNWTHRFGNGSACWSEGSAESLKSLFFCLPPDIAFSRSFRNWLLFKLLDRPLKIIVLSGLPSPLPPLVHRFPITHRMVHQSSGQKPFYRRLPLLLTFRDLTAEDGISSSSCRASGLCRRGSARVSAALGGCPPLLLRPTWEELVSWETPQSSRDKTSACRVENRSVEVRRPTDPSWSGFGISEAFPRKSVEGAAVAARAPEGLHRSSSWRRRRPPTAAVSSARSSCRHWASGSPAASTRARDVGAAD